MAMARTASAIVAGKGTILLEVVSRMVVVVVVVLSAMQEVPELSATLGEVQAVTHWLF